MLMHGLNGQNERENRPSLLAEIGLVLEILVWVSRRIEIQQEQPRVAVVTRRLSSAAAAVAAGVWRQGDTF